MGYTVTHRCGDMDRDFPIEAFGELLDELAKADLEHPDIAVTHESEWSLSVHKTGMLLLEHLEVGEALRFGPIGRDATLNLMALVAEGRIDEALRVAASSKGDGPARGRVSER